MINAAIVGLGRWGRTLVGAVQGTSERIRFTAGVTRTPSKAEDFCRDKGFPVGDDYDAMLADPAIDAVVLATPHTLHFEQVMAAARAGKHVFCEKPFALTRAEAETGLAALADAGLTAGTGYNRRFAPNTIELKRVIDDGGLGEILHVEGNFSANISRYADEWRTNRAESPAGGMTSLGVHAVDAFIHLIGRIAEVEARSTRLSMPFDVDDTTAMLLTFESGCTGYLATIAATGHLWYVRVFGTGGWAEIRFLDRFEIMSADGGHDVKTWEGYDYPGMLSITAVLESFAEAAEGGAPFAISPEDILHGAAVLEAIIRSAEDGGSVAIG